MDPTFDMDWHQLERFSFGDSPALADELAALVRRHEDSNMLGGVGWRFDLCRQANGCAERIGASVGDH